jgi:hypothetical protein
MLVGKITKEIRSVEEAGIKTKRNLPMTCFVPFTIRTIARCPLGSRLKRNPGSYLNRVVLKEGLRVKRVMYCGDDEEAS